MLWHSQLVRLVRLINTLNKVQLLLVIYRIVGIFRGRKLSRIGGKNGISQRKLSWIACLYCLLSTEPSRTLKFADRHKTAKFAKVFILGGFPLNGIHMYVQVCDYGPVRLLLPWCR